MSEPKLESGPTDAALCAERQAWYRAAGLTLEDFQAHVQRRRNATPATTRQEQAA